MTQVRVILSLLLATFLLNSPTVVNTNEAGQELLPVETPENQEPTQTEVVENEHHRTKRSPYDPLIPALLLGKSAFLLGTVLGPKLFYHPYPHRRPHYHRSFGHGHGHGHHGGHGGGYGGGYGHGGHGGGHGGYGRGWGWK